MNILNSFSYLIYHRNNRTSLSASHQYSIFLMEWFLWNVDLIIPLSNSKILSFSQLCVEVQIPQQGIRSLHSLTPLSFYRGSSLKIFFSLWFTPSHCLAPTNHSEPWIYHDLFMPLQLLLLFEVAIPNLFFMVCCSKPPTVSWGSCVVFSDFVEFTYIPLL